MFTKTTLFINRTNTNKNAENIVYKQPSIHVLMIPTLRPMKFTNSESIKQIKKYRNAETPQKHTLKEDRESRNYANPNQRPFSGQKM